MLNIQSHVSLKPYNSFRIEAKARYFVEINHEEDLSTLLQLAEFVHTPKLILGGGSNVLLRQDFNGLVVAIAIQGIDVVREDDKHVYVRAGGGVNWQELVLFCVRQGYAGLENLSLIPGTVGASPIQNIGAYGVELEQAFDSLKAVHVITGEQRTFMRADCQFGYRDSVFKRDLKGQYIITSVTFQLDKQATFHTRYGAIQETLAAMGVDEATISIKAVSEAVTHIRRSKLPDPAQIGNAGSFFKNPTISQAHHNALKEKYPTLPGYPVDETMVKVPAGWLIEQAGWKGYRSGDAGVHAKQALVLVNYGNATGNDILTLAGQIQQSVHEQFGIEITPEVNIV